MIKQYLLLILLVFGLLMGSELNGQTLYLVDEGFESAAVPPAGWFYTTGVQHSTDRSRTGARSARFSSNDHSIHTPLLSTPEELNFWLYRNPGGRLNVQVQRSITPNTPDWNNFSAIADVETLGCKPDTNLFLNPPPITKSVIIYDCKSGARGNRSFYIDGLFIQQYARKTIKTMSK